MTIEEKIETLFYDLYVDLNAWEKDFISKVHEGIDGLDGITDQDIGEYLTPRQIEKVQEIFERVGII